jgi:hypothetical protein
MMNCNMQWSDDCAQVKWLRAATKIRRFTPDSAA